MVENNKYPYYKQPHEWPHKPLRPGGTGSQHIVSISVHILSWICWDVGIVLWLFFNLGYSCFTKLCWFLLYNRVSYMYTYIPSFLDLPPYPSRSSESTKLSSLHYTVSSFPLAIYFTHGTVRASVPIPIYPLHPPPPIQMSILYICVSIPALQIGSFVPFF